MNKKQRAYHAWASQRVMDYLAKDKLTSMERGIVQKLMTGGLGCGSLTFDEECEVADEIYNLVVREVAAKRLKQIDEHQANDDGNGAIKVFQTKQFSEQIEGNISTTMYNRIRERKNNGNESKN